MNDALPWFNLFLSLSGAYMWFVKFLFHLLFVLMVVERLIKLLPAKVFIVFAWVTVVFGSAALFDQILWRPDLYTQEQGSE